MYPEVNFPIDFHCLVSLIHRGLLEMLSRLAFECRIGKSIGCFVWCISYMASCHRISASYDDILQLVSRDFFKDIPFTYLRMLLGFLKLFLKRL